MLFTAEVALALEGHNAYGEKKQRTKLLACIRKTCSCNGILFILLLMLALSLVSFGF